MLSRSALPPAALAAAGLCLALGSAPPAPSAAAPRAASRDPGPGEPGPQQPEQLEDYELMSCWGCHESIADEWAASAHALAWVSPRYQDAIADRRRPAACHGCHIPERLQTADLSRKPEPRSEELESLHYAISCRSCHEAEDGAMLGPLADPVENGAHASRRSEGFTPSGSNALCIACHQTNIGPVIGVARDFVATDQAAAGKSCIGCHMDPLRRSVAIDDDERPTPERDGRSHRLNGPRDPEFLASAFEVSASRRDGWVVVELANRAAHRVPGLVDRVLRIRAEVLDAAGEVSGSTEAEVTTRAYVAADDVLELAVDGPGDRVRVTGVHEAEALPEPVRFLELELPLGSR